MMPSFRYTITLLFFLSALVSFGQGKKEMRQYMKDSVDGKFDFSDFLIKYPGGFLPVPNLITEPAFGNFGFSLTPVFLKKRPPSVEEVKGVRKSIPNPPDITGLTVMYTANNSWAVFAFRSATWIKPKIKYRIGGGYADMNMDFYHTGASGDEKKYGLNFRAIPFGATILKQLRAIRWSTGISYLFIKSDITPTEGELPPAFPKKDFKALLSMPGVVVEYEGRDNIFTPDKGIRFHTSMAWSNEAFGSKWNYSNFNVYGYFYYPIRRNLIGGLRLENQQVSGDTPFYLLPYLDLRGIPVARYQGNIFSVGEVEFRWDIVSRWSAVFFAGSGKAYDSWSGFSDASWHSSGGGGFRYLIARKFKLRAGLDLARGPEQWAYYLVFGSSWRR